MRLGKTTLAIATAAAGVVLATSTAPALGTPGTPHVRSATTTTPLLTIKMSGKHSLHVVGSTTFSAGLVDLKLIAGNGEQTFDIIRLHNGYTFADFKRDFRTFSKSQQQQQQKPTRAELKAFRHLLANTTFNGGIDSGSGHKTVTGTVTLPQAGTYLILIDNNGPDVSVTPVKLTVTAQTGERTAPTVSAVETATTAKRFTGPTHLPASGTIEFKNLSTESPHLMILLHVKKGTTRKQVIKALQSNGPGPILPGAVGADVISHGVSMTLTYTLPAGDYAQLCFFPDPKTGMPHAFMGMVRIVHLS